MLLSTYRRRRDEGDPGDKPVRVNRGVGTEETTLTSADIGTEPGPKNDAGVHTLYPTPATGTRGSTTQQKAGLIDQQTEFDEYGTELHRDARVWKVYVQETDKYDGDLVKSWNDSTDVILIFAALFSAISTAFLIESSKMLQADPADVSARTLVTISQTLVALANGTQLPGSLAPPTDSSTAFVPSRAAICVNTLWYLSLSLSLATSFIAILSKDWCHSFMSGRTGHPYAQTCRRQQKWDMLERWKMSELLAVLPSMIHVALLLFSVGLCILLWDTHFIVALPVICISGIAFGFYAWSSVTAIFLDAFPYPTIISKLCRTEPVQLLYRFVIHSHRLVPWFLLYIGVWPFKCVFDGLHGLSDRLSDDGPNYSRVRDWVRRRAYWLWKRLNGMSWGHLAAEQWIDTWFKKPTWRLKPGGMAQGFSAQGGFSDPTESKAKGLALSWLIKNCEVPRSIDIALQSIAGATNRISPQPFLECQAPLQILRRLASSTLYRNPDAKSEATVALYVRALSFLGTSAKSNTNEGMKQGSELEGLIWDLQMETEKKVAALIELGNFEPTQHNIDSLRIGSTVASNSLKIVQQKLNHTDTRVIFDSIITNLQSHGTQPLHEAALLSLAHAATLLLLFSPASLVALRNNVELPPALSATSGNISDLSDDFDYTDTHTLLSLCAKLAEERPSGLISSLATTCIFLYNTAKDRMRKGGTAWLEEILRGLIDGYSQDDTALNLIYGIEPPGISTSEQAYDFQIYFSRMDTHFSLNNRTQDVMAQIGSQNSHVSVDNIILPELRALHTARYVTPLIVLSPAIYFLVVEVMCRSPPSSPLFACGAQMLSKCPFPTLSDELATALEQRDLVPLLETTSTSDNQTKQYFARGQLWLLLSVYIYAGDTASGREKLKVQLDKCRRNGSKSEEEEHEALGLRLWDGFISVRRDERGVWVHRLNECVNQLLSRGFGYEDNLRNVPSEIRGLSSFTAWPRRATDPATTELRRVEEPTGAIEEREGGIDSTTKHEGVTSGDGHLQSAGVVADTGEAETQREDDARRADSSQDIEATTQGPQAGDGKSVADVNLEEEVGEVRGEGNSWVEAEGDEQRVTDADDAKEATDGPQSEGEEAESRDPGHGRGNEGDVMIRMDMLETRSDGSAKIKDATEYSGAVFCSGAPP